MSTSSDLKPKKVPITDRVRAVAYRMGMGDRIMPVVAMSFGRGVYIGRRQVPMRRVIHRGTEVWFVGVLGGLTLPNAILAVFEM